MPTTRIEVPINRVEGDLEVHAEIEDGRVSDAWVKGTMYRGIERVLVGRGAKDGLVITPRVCGMCTTSHLSAAARALEAISFSTPPPNAVAVRDLVLATEHVQSDLRHSVLTFAADFSNPAWKDLPLHAEAVRRFAPLAGETAVEVIRETRKVLEIAMTFSGQWPHSSFMVPGGVVCVPAASDLLQCRLLLARFRAWYESRVLGCDLARWGAVASAGELAAFVEESPAQRDGLLGFFVRFCRAAGLDRIGRAHGAFLSFGGLEPGAGTGGFSEGNGVDQFAPDAIEEHVAHSWYADEGPRHPSNGETRPYATGNEGTKYSWTKAPRYRGRAVETGPLAESVMARDPLVLDLLAREGASAFVRQLARLTRPARLVTAMEKALASIRPEEPFYAAAGEIPDGSGAGLVSATRGLLGHWVRVKDGRIESYQIITPTGWNASPRDGAGQRGPMEEALVGTPVRDLDNPVELGHVVRSFDACLVCTVHAVRKDGGRSVTVRIAP